MEDNADFYEDLNQAVFTSAVHLIKPLDSIKDFKQFGLLKDGLDNCGITEFNPLQKAVVPYLNRGDDIFVIGGRRSGKSLSYLIPIVGRLLTGDLDGSSNFISVHNRQLSTSSPYLLVICANLEFANRIKDHLSALLQSITNNRRHLSYDVVGQWEDLAKLSSGLNIIITTLPFFQKMMGRNPNFINFKNLKYLVYENLDVLYHFDKEFEYVRKIMTGFAALPQNQWNYQRIFVGEVWSISVERIYQSVNPLSWGNAAYPPKDSLGCTASAPTLFINSSNDLIKYSNVAWHFHYLNKGNVDDKRISKLQELLREVSSHKSIFIICSTAEIATAVYKGLMNTPGISIHLAETSSIDQVDKFKFLKAKWDLWNIYHPEEQQVMVLNDEALKHLNIRNVTCLIHYDLPLPNPKHSSKIRSSCYQGAERFICMWDNIRSIAIEKSNPSLTSKCNKAEIEAHFLLLETERMMPARPRSCIKGLRTYLNKKQH